MLNNHVLSLVGDTPLVQLTPKHLGYIDLYAKLEYFNPNGSVKDRAAKYIIDKLLHTGEISSNTLIIESSSGNFGISLAAYCKFNNLKFHCVIDPLISPINELLIRSQGAEVTKVTERDANGGYLLNRIQKIEELRQVTADSYWINQYQNPYNAEAYYHSLGEELNKQCERIDYIFIGVSSGGTITGLSQSVKKNFPHCKVIAVDIDGSVLFGGTPKKRFIPGIGSSLVPPILEQAYIDEVVVVNEYDTVMHCRELLKNQYIFAGGSSGSIMAAITSYFAKQTFSVPPAVVGIFCDRGDRYATTIYDDRWVEEVFEQHILSGGDKHALSR
ncbi:2,3-diaminopropionate biosynthesis protein SbnA [Paenibacillus sp. KS-LC4]|uniref:2,3-diaminopropionate biosynthesis protein SbnA n=1 Tax=Paenibacillus sp. KS-LC4 TaxID=2979727 RepID=UPI0030D2C5F0